MRLLAAAICRLSAVQTPGPNSIRKELFARGYRYRLNDKRLPGKPDLVLKKYRAVIFVHGCFWHRHNCPLFKWPSTRAEWWKEKLEGNRVRDQRQLSELQELGWRTLVVWECALKGKLRLQPEDLFEQIEGWLLSDISHSEVCGSF